MREFGADLAAVNSLQERENVLQLHPGATRPGQPPGVKLLFEIPVFDSEEIELQHGRDVSLPEPERIKIRDLVSAEAVDLNQP